MYFGTVPEYEAWLLLEQEDGARDTDPALRQVDEAMQPNNFTGNESSGRFDGQLLSNSARREMGPNGE